MSVPRTETGQFVKGVSGNPRGPQKGLARLVRETVGDDIAAIIKAQVAIAQGKKPDGITDLPPIKASDMTKAAEWLADRGWGKPEQAVNLSGDMTVSTAPAALPALTEEQLAVAALLDEGLDDSGGANDPG